MKPFLKICGTNHELSFVVHVSASSTLTRTICDANEYASIISLVGCRTFFSHSISFIHFILLQRIAKPYRALYATSCIWFVWCVVHAHTAARIQFIVHCFMRWFFVVCVFSVLYSFVFIVSLSQHIMCFFSICFVCANRWTWNTFGID